MLDHIILTVSNIERSLAFYEAALEPLNIRFFGAAPATPASRRGSETCVTRRSMRLLTLRPERAWRSAACG
jgi:catechol 2,3-dioxygenase-like lactoylglutathione lyase family enzyme